MMGMSPVNLKSALSSKKVEKPIGLNLAERIYRLQVIKQLIRERHMAHSAEEYNEGNDVIALTLTLIIVFSNSKVDWHFIKFDAWWNSLLVSSNVDVSRQASQWKKK